MHLPFRQLTAGVGIQDIVPCLPCLLRHCTFARPEQVRQLLYSPLPLCCTACLGLSSSTVIYHVRRRVDVGDQGMMPSLVTLQRGNCKPILAVMRYRSLNILSSSHVHLLVRPFARLILAICCDDCCVRPGPVRQCPSILGAVRSDRILQLRAFVYRPS
jgi:hypothetical protein